MEGSWFKPSIIRVLSAPFPTLLTTSELFLSTSCCTTLQQLKASKLNLLTTTQSSVTFFSTHSISLTTFCNLFSSLDVTIPLFISLYCCTLITIMLVGLMISSNVPTTTGTTNNHPFFIRNLCCLQNSSASSFKMAMPLAFKTPQRWPPIWINLIDKRLSGLTL